MGKKLKQKMSGFMRSDSGAVAATTAILMTVLLGFMAYAIDIGHLVLVKSEMQRAADAAALAGVRALYPYDLSTVTSSSLTINTTSACGKATETIAKNAVDGASLETAEVTTTPGIYNWENNTFTPNGSPLADTNALRVEINEHTVNYFFAGILGTQKSNVSVNALAVMSYAKGLPPGTMPIAIGKKYLSQLDGTKPISFAPDKEDNAGWFGIEKVSNSTIVDYIVNDSCPAIELNDIVNLLNGKTNACDSLSEKFNLNKNSEGYWDVDLPVVDTEKFNKDFPIDSFVKFRVTGVDTHNKTVTGRVIGMALTSPGGKPGGPKGDLLTPPKLVAYN
jgi:Flp pilus assembly protein TadG